MFAVIRTGGKQYKVSKDDKVKVELLDAKVGESVECEVLFAEGGKGAKVTAKVYAHDRDDTVLIFKKRRRQNSRRRRGHRQHFTILQIADVKAA